MKGTEYLQPNIVLPNTSISSPFISNAVYASSAAAPSVFTANTTTLNSTRDPLVSRYVQNAFPPRTSTDHPRLGASAIFSQVSTVPSRDDSNFDTSSLVPAMIMSGIGIALIAVVGLFLRRSLREATQSHSLTPTLSAANPLALDPTAPYGIRQFATLQAIMDYLSHPDNNLTRKKDDFLDRTRMRVASIQDMVDIDGNPFYEVRITAWKDRKQSSLDCYRTEYALIYTFDRDGQHTETRASQKFMHLIPFHVGFQSYQAFGGPAYTVDVLRKHQFTIFPSRTECCTDRLPEDRMQHAFKVMKVSFPNVQDEALLKKATFKALVAWQAMTREQKREATADSEYFNETFLNEGGVDYSYIERAVEHELEQAKRKPHLK